MKTWTTTYVYDRTWEYVAQAVVRKYPNPHKPEVISTDVVEREVKSGILYSHRLINSKWGFPSWSKKIIGNIASCFAHEVSSIDPLKKEVFTYSKNITLENTLSYDERQRFVPHPTDPSKTLLHQETVINVSGVPFSSFIESYLMANVTANSHKGNDAMNWILSKIDSEVDDFVSTCKKTHGDLVTSLDDIKTTAQKSIDDISTSIKNIDNFQPPNTPPTRTIPRI